jgi:hypothetical protein
MFEFYKRIGKIFTIVVNTQIHDFPKANNTIFIYYKKQNKAFTKFLIRGHHVRDCFSFED